MISSRADQIKSQLDRVAGDPRATWRRAQSLLHTNHKVVHNDAECATIVSTFCCRFFVDQVDRIHDNIATARASCLLTDHMSQSHSRRSLPRKCIACCQPCPPSHRHWTFYLVHCWVMQSLPQSLPDLPIYQCRPDNFLPGESKRRSYHCWRKLVLTACCQETTGWSPIFRLSQQYWSGLYWHACALTCSCHPISASTSPKYTKGHSTETALLELLDRVYMAASLLFCFYCIFLYC